MKIRFLIVFCSTVFFYNCSKEDLTSKKESTSEKTKIIYQNNFENEEDLKGIEGYADLVENDFPQFGGKYCLSVSGGCIIPHLSFNVAIEENNTIVASAFVKGESEHCGEINIAIEGSDKSISIPLGPQIWTNVKSNETLDVKKGDLLMVTISSGGFISCSSFVDNFLIESL
jgi:hypothetical protein